MNTDTDNLLKEWAATKTAQPEHLDALRASIRISAVEANVSSGVTQSMPFLTRLSYALLGAVVALAVSIPCMLRLASSPSVEETDGSAGRFATISPERMDSGRRLYSEVGALFPDRLRWISESNGDMNLGVEQIGKDPGSDSHPAMVRLVVLSRAHGQTEWRAVWNTDVILHGEDMVEAVPNRNNDNRLSLWVYPLSDGKIAVDTSLTLCMPMVVESRMNAVVAPGEPTELAVLKTGDAEYKVLQTVVTL